MQNPIKKIQENILGKKLVALIETGGPMAFENPDNGKTYAIGNSKIKELISPDLAFRPYAIAPKEEGVIMKDRAEYLAKIVGLIDKGANVNYAGSSGQEKTPLDMLCQVNGTLYAEAVITQPPTKEGRPSFEPAFKTGASRSPAEDVARILLKNGAHKMNAAEKEFGTNFPKLKDQLDASKQKALVGLKQKQGGR